MNKNVGNAIKDLPVQITSSTSMPKSWLISITKKTANYIKAVIKQAEYLWNSNSNESDADTPINLGITTESLIPQPNNSRSITDGNTDNISSDNISFSARYK